MDIKEIALRVGAQGLPIEGTAHKFCMLDFCSKEVLIEFAEALIAEIAKQNEPVAYATTNEEDDLTMLFFDEDEARKYSGDDAPIKLYTIPPTAEQIANETAEAIAEYCRNQDHYCLATEIESGAWKEFKK